MGDAKKPAPAPKLPRLDKLGTPGAPGESIPPPPEGVAHLPWDLFQTLMKTCRGDTPPPRKDSFLPYLVIRAYPGDRGGRPINVPFWESPDILVMPDQHAASAPPIPPFLGGFPTAGHVTTVYAHVWNLGRGPAIDVRVEFFAGSPGFGNDNLTLLGFTYLSLGARGGSNCHAVVHCPVDWTPPIIWAPLVVRAFSLDDPLGPDGFDASKNRHVARRNMTTVDPVLANPITLRVAPGLNVHDAQIMTMRISPQQVPWMHLLTMRRDLGLRAPSITPLVGVTPPMAVLDQGASGLNLAALSDDALARLLAQQHRFRPSAEPMQVTLVAKAPNMVAGEAQVVRVQQVHDGTVVGGFTIILLP